MDHDDGGAGAGGGSGYDRDEHHDANVCDQRYCCSCDEDDHGEMTFRNAMSTRAILQRTTTFSTWSSSFCHDAFWTCDGNDDNAWDCNNSSSSGAVVLWDRRDDGDDNDDSAHVPKASHNANCSAHVWRICSF